MKYVGRGEPGLGEAFGSGGCIIKAAVMEFGGYSNNKPWLGIGPRQQLQALENVD